MQPIRTIWTILVGDHPGIIIVEFGQKLAVQEKRSFELFLIYFNVKCWPPRAGSILTPRPNLNNFGRGPLDDAMYQKWKLWALLFQTRKYLKIAFWKPIFWPHDLLMQLIRAIWTISVRDHPETIPVKFGKIPISGSREEVVCSFPYIIQCKIVTPRAGSILTPGG